MFTGLVKEIGTVTQSFSVREGRKIRIYSQQLIPQIEIDDSVAVNGVCQTVVWVGGKEFEIQVVPTTLKKTTLGNLKSGDAVNLELALTLQDRLGGHLVQGHVNGVGTICQIQKQGETYLLSLRFPTELSQYIVEEGSLTVDGISLTIAEYQLGNSELVLAIIPHTWNHTVLKNKQAGDKVNIEVDIVAKYVENLLFYRNNLFSNVNRKGITEEYLKEKGFS